MVVGGDTDKGRSDQVELISLNSSRIVKLNPFPQTICYAVGAPLIPGQCYFVKLSLCQNSLLLVSCLKEAEKRSQLAA
jgi:hypothetical protein